MKTFNERPLLALMNPTANKDMRDVPLIFYEEIIRVTKGGTQSEFAPTAFRITSDEVMYVYVCMYVCRYTCIQ